MVDGKGLVAFLSKHKLTANQFLLCHLLYAGDQESISIYVTSEYKNKHNRDVSLAFKRSEIEDLIERDFIKKIGDDDTGDAFQVTGTFSRSYYIDTEEAGEQFWDEFPNLITVDGMYQSTKTCDKDKLIESYMRKIKHSRKKHDFVMRMLNHYRDLIGTGEMAGMGIEKFVGGENWNVVAEAVGKTYDGSSFI